jgi:nicotinamidase-related amidase
MLNVSGIDIPRTVEEAVCLDRSALIVYDMQIGILRQMKDAEAIVEKVNTVLEAAREVGLRTYFLRHTSLPKNLMGRFQVRQALAWQGTDDPDEIMPWFPRDADGTKIIPKLAPRETEAVFDKLTMSAFEGTPLDFALRDCDIHTVLVCGVATEIGIEPTVRHAADLGYVPVVIEDACGPGHAEAGERALESLRFMGDAMFTTVEEVTDMLHEKAPESRRA